MGREGRPADRQGARDREAIHRKADLKVASCGAGLQVPLFIYTVVAVVIPSVVVVVIVFPSGDRTSRARTTGRPSSFCVSSSVWSSSWRYALVKYTSTPSTG